MCLINFTITNRQWALFGHLWAIPAKYLLILKSYNKNEEGEKIMKKGDIVYNKFFGYGIVLEVSPDSAKIQFDSLKTSRDIKTGFYKKVG